MALSLMILSATITFAQIKGKVVGVIDGDSLTLPAASDTHIKIRRHGNDCADKWIWLKSKPFSHQE
jgi:endonuclease YncB( thermonuclease family)